MSLFGAFDAMHHYSYQKDLHLENEKNIIVDFGEEGLRSRTQESVLQLIDLGVNATRDVMNLFSAKLKEDLKKEEERARQEAERQEAIRLEKAAAEAKAAREKAAAEAKAAREKAAAEHKQHVAAIDHACAGPKVLRPLPDGPTPIQQTLADILAGHTPLTAELAPPSSLAKDAQRIATIVVDTVKEHPVLLDIAARALPKSLKYPYDAIKVTYRFYQTFKPQEVPLGPPSVKITVIKPAQGTNIFAAKRTDTPTPAPSSNCAKAPPVKDVPLAQHPEFSKIFDQKTLQAIENKFPAEIKSELQLSDKTGMAYKVKHGRNNIRIQKGDPSSDFPSRRVDYVKVNRDGDVIGKDRNPIRSTPECPDPSNSPDAHIPLEDWLKWSSFNGK